MAGGYFDTSGLDNAVYGGTTNNAAADFERLNAENPNQFGKAAGIFDRLFGGQSKKERQQEALQTSASAPVATGAPTPLNPTASAAAAAKPQIASAPSLVKSVLQQIANPPQYSANGEALVPGTPFTPQQFAEQLLAPVVAQMNALAPPPEALQASPGDVRSPAAAPFQGVPQFGPTADGPPQRQPPSAFGNQRFGGNTFGGNRFGGNTFGGNTFGGNTFGGNTFGASAAPPTAQGAAAAPPQSPQGPMTPMDPLQRLLMLARSGRPSPQMTPMPDVGYFRGGALKMMRGGYPDLMSIEEPPNLPMREPYASGGNYVPSDGRGDGRSDHVAAKLSPGEFVMDAETVALAGNGDSDAGARGMEAIRQTIRKEKGKQLARGKFSPNARQPGYYANIAMKKGAK